MFSAATLAHRPQQFAAAYRQVGAETGVAGASPHKLVMMLFDGYMESLAQAKGAMRARQYEPKGRAIQRAIRIVEEGLRGCLDMKGGGNLAQDLNDLYGYLTMRLTMANLRNDEAALDECQRLMQPLREAWSSIAGQVDDSGNVR
ncbi:MAG: flagellar export chaperone FliS [Rubrivivax sp.]|mgnify:CR=1 FL=1